MKELENRVALVTGASRGIGRAVSLTLAKAGAQLVLTGRDLAALDETSKLITELNVGPTPLVCQMDLLDSSSIEGAVKLALDSFGQIDVLVNNSGINGMRR